MKTKLKKWHVVLMSFVALVFAIFTSLFNLKADPVDDETGEILTDNWNFDIVFYDSSVDNGKTPLTEIDWDATNGSYEKGTPRTITIQINYKNDNAVTTYQPGEVVFSIPNLIYSNSQEEGTASTALWDTQAIVSANYGDNKGEFWNFVPNKAPDNTQKIYSFSNNEIIEETANFQGTIQIKYTITPGYDSPEYYENECTVNYNKNLKVTLDAANASAESNELSFNYTRTHSHVWTKEPYKLTKTASKLTSMDGFPEGTNNYYWVKYSFSMSDTHDLPSGTSSFPYIAAMDFYIEDSFPTNCLVLSENLTELTPFNGSTYRIYHNGRLSDPATPYVYVGYPRAEYNTDANNLAITNTAYLYGKYLSEEAQSLLKESSVSLNLSNFEFQYSGNLYSLSKSTTGYNKLIYQGITGENPLFNDSISSSWTLTPTTKYVGDKYDIHVGDDLIFVPLDNGDYRKLNDDEYYFKSISFPVLKNGSNQTITEKYTVQLYTRTANSTNFELYSEFLNTSKTFNFTQQDAIVGFYFVIKDVVTDIKSSTITFTINFHNISEIAQTTSYLYNFGFLEIYIDGELANPVTENSYSSYLSKFKIASYDISTYGHYIQRAYTSYRYSYYINPKLDTKQTIYKSMGTVNKDAENEVFTGTASVITAFERTDLYGEEQSDLFDPDEFAEVYIATSGETFDYAEGNTGFIYYDLLPLGMQLTSTEEEIINSIGEAYAQYNATYLYDYHKNNLTMEQLYEMIKENTTIEIIENYNQTGRTLLKITVDLRKNPIYYLYITTNFSANGCGFKFLYDYSISYDAFLEFGSVWSNRIYCDAYGNEFRFASNDTYRIAYDNGSYDSQEADINQDGDYSEIFAYSSSSTTINHVISTHQDVTKYVKTEYSDYATGTVDSPCDAEYQYKLRVRTGQNDITNLIIYDSLETAQPERQRWQGEFLGIDTSFAEARTYKLLRPNDPNADTNGYISYNIKINPYYSENPAAGNLYNEDGTLNSDWKVFLPHYKETYGNGMAITFNKNFKTYNSDDYLCIYYYYNNVLFCSPKYSGTDLAGKTIEIPALDCYFYWYTSATRNTGYGFSIDDINPVICNTVLGTNVASLPAYQAVELSGNNYPETPHNPYKDGARDLWHYTLDDTLVQEYVEGTDRSKVKALAFEYVNADGTAAIIPANNMTHVLINMKSPEDESITTLARNNCRTQWNALDDYDKVVDFVTGINSNVVKVALPNSVDEDSVSSITLKFTKEIQGTDSQFDYMQLDKAAQQVFKIRLISLVENEDGTYNQITAVLKNDQELIIDKLPIGSYLLEEFEDNYFDFVEFTNNNEPEIIIEGVTLEKTLIGYILTISEELTESIEFNIKVTNEIENFRPFEDKSHKENLFSDHKPRTVFAVQSNDDRSLTFFNRPDVPEEGSVYKTYIDGELYEKTVTHLYTDFIETETTPWLPNIQMLHSVVVADKISPTSTARWFGVLSVIEYYDLRKLDTSNVTTMEEMFSGASIKGPGVDVIVLGLENWDTSKVENMNYIFVNAFNLDTNPDFSGITNWDVSNVKYANGALAGLNPRSDSFELDLSGWNLESIIEMDDFLAGTPKLTKLTLGPNFKFVDAVLGQYDSTPYLPAPTHALSDGSGLWYIEGTNIGLAPEDVHKNATETTTYVVFPTN